MFYAVRGGPHAGIYSTWDEASRFSKGHSGALCKKFKDRDSAVAFLGTAEQVVPAQPRVGAYASNCPVLLNQTPADAQPNSSMDAQLTDLSLAGRIYLQVPFAEKDAVKALGAKWDPEQKKWFAQSALLHPALMRWLPQGPQLSCDPSCQNTVQRKRPMGDVFLPMAERKAMAEARLDELALYTDGACKGNNHVASKMCPAGWGVAVVGGGGTHGNHGRGTGLLVVELFGPVVLDSTSPFFLGAEVASNNTGELSAICEALLWLLLCEPSDRPAVLLYDSTYAAKITLGQYRAEKNQVLAAKARSLFQEVSSQRKVRFEHVKGHSNDKWNDAADALANRGAGGEVCSTGRYGSELVASSSCLRADGSGQPLAKRARIGAA